MAYSTDLELLLSYAFPVFALLIIGEAAVIALRGRGALKWRELICSILIGAGNRFVRPFTIILLSPLFFWLYDMRLWTVPTDTWWGIALLFVGVELAYYWMHRHSHSVGWMWANHVVHHSPTQISFATAVRLGWTDLVALTWIYWLPLFLLGLHPAAVFLCYGIGLVYQFILHTEMVPRLWGPVEWLFNTPSNHRVHHASEPVYHDKNFGNVLMVFDHVFGTYAKEDPELLRGRYGVHGWESRFNPLKVLTDGWLHLIRECRREVSWRQRLGRLLMRPGYSGGAPDNASGKAARSMS